MVRPERDRLNGWVEVDETLVGGLEEGVAGRQTESKALVVIAAQADGPGIGRIRMRVIDDASADSLHLFVKDCIEPGSTVHSDGWQGYAGLDNKGYQREITLLRGRRKEASKLMPRVHRVASLLKRWLLGTHQGAVAPRHLPYYLDWWVGAHGILTQCDLIGRKVKLKSKILQVGIRYADDVVTRNQVSYA